MKFLILKWRVVCIFNLFVLFIYRYDDLLVPFHYKKNNIVRYLYSIYVIVPVLCKCYFIYYEKINNRRVSRKSKQSTWR